MLLLLICSSILNKQTHLNDLAPLLLSLSLRCKKGAWKKEHTLKNNIEAGISGNELPDNFNLEQYINAEVVEIDDE